VVSIYDRLSKYETEDGVVIVYGSMYGNTQEMAEAIATRLAERGVKKIKMHNVSYSHLSYILSDIFQYKGLIIGAPTYSNTLFPLIESVVQAIKTRELKNRVVGSFGSFTWASKAVKRINEVLEESHLLDTEIVSVENKQAPGAIDIEKCRALADAIVDKM
jgi:flavorubredoxin